MTDLIRRSVLIDEICRSSIYKWSVEEDQGAHNWALNIINSQPSVESSKGDLISRDDAKKAVYLLGKRPQINEIWDCLDALPSADAVQGEWIHDGQNFKGGLDWSHCSECGYKTSTKGLRIYRYCPNCGARMKGGDTE